MTILFVILIIIASFILGLIVLIQNPKGGGLAGTFGGLSTQFMGVKQTTDVLEKGTWIFAGLIALLCLLSSFFISNTGTGVQDTNSNAAGAPLPQQRPQNNQSTFPLGTPGTTAPQPGTNDTNK